MDIRPEIKDNDSHEIPAASLFSDGALEGPGIDQQTEEEKFERKRLKEQQRRSEMKQRMEDLLGFLVQIDDQVKSEVHRHQILHRREQQKFPLASTDAAASSNTSSDSSLAGVFSQGELLSRTLRVLHRIHTENQVRKQVISTALAIQQPRSNPNCTNCDTLPSEGENAAASSSINNSLSNQQLLERMSTLVAADKADPATRAFHIGVAASNTGDNSNDALCTLHYPTAHRVLLDILQRTSTPLSLTSSLGPSYADAASASASSSLAPTANVTMQQDTCIAQATPQRKAASDTAPLTYEGKTASPTDATEKKLVVDADAPIDEQRKRLSGYLSNARTASLATANVADLPNNAVTHVPTEEQRIYYASLLANFLAASSPTTSSATAQSTSTEQLETGSSSSEALEMLIASAVRAVLHRPENMDPIPGGQPPPNTPQVQEPAPSIGVIEHQQSTVQQQWALGIITSLASGALTNHSAHHQAAILLLLTALLSQHNQQQQAASQRLSGSTDSQTVHQQTLSPVTISQLAGQQNEHQTAQVFAALQSLLNNLHQNQAI